MNIIRHRQDEPPEQIFAYRRKEGGIRFRGLLYPPSPNHVPSIARRDQPSPALQDYRLIWYFDKTASLPPGRRYLIFEQIDPEPVKPTAILIRIYGETDYFKIEAGKGGGSELPRG